jgi:plasmid stability protein
MWRGCWSGRWRDENPRESAIACCAIIAYNLINDDEDCIVASITIRNLDDSLKSRLRIQAEAHGRSMEEEERDLLRSALNREVPQPGKLADAIRARFAPLGGFDLPEVPREPMREPPTFD